MKKIILTVIVFSSILLLTFCSQKIKKNPAISADEIYEHIAYLASDSLQGRLPGSAGGRLASAYIQQQFINYGLKPLCDEGFQHFTVTTGCSAGEKNYMVLNNDTLIMGTDYLPLAFSANAELSSRVVFAGYGFEIENENLKWNDYAMIDVTGKWVMLLREDPEPENMESAFIPFASDRVKATLAKDKGAAGVLFVNGVSTSKTDKPLELNYDQNLSDAGIPLISITRAVANKILAGTERIEALEKNIMDKKSPVIIRTKTQVSAKTDVIHDTVQASNVVFAIHSKVPDAKYVVIGAHFDHLGMGGKGVSSRQPDTVAVHNGADDNASGVAGIIELAGYFAAKSDTLKKNLIFVAFDGEEMGILGSKYFTQNLPVPKEQISVMINFDMIGRMKADSIGITVGGTGTATEFDSLLAVHQPAFNVTPNPDGYGPSDHASFYALDIPVLFLSTGAHEDYHTPIDDIDKIDTSKEAELLHYSTRLIGSLVADTNSLTFQSTGLPQGSQRRTRLKITLGIIPDMNGVQKNGLGIDGVRPGGLADKNGLLKGDKITSINGEPVTNIYDYMYRMAKLKTGTTAVVEFERNHKKEVVLILL
ncbi:MAG: M28 family peptidase [Salinivirgaceae bacterium]